ncbi:MAG: pre-peptidase C-terminal domain-containing protein [Candidatus Hydrogenedentes bacterium]|nr:pre-peptidase C-terminal domain-containing protein [Candidatus Hydrogenedentota bacterium]
MKNTTVRVNPRWLCLVTFLLLTATAWSQSSQREQHIGYLYPAGGKQGTTFQVTVGGQFLRRVTDVYVSGEGVTASLVRYVGNFKLDGPQRRELRRQVDLRWNTLRKQPTTKYETPIKRADGEPVKLPDHPLINNLDTMNLREVAYIRSLFANVGKQQPNSQIAEIVLIEVTIAPDAIPGRRELRLDIRTGFTNPMIFEVGQTREVLESEYNDPNTRWMKLPDLEVADLPVVLNGQILPGDIDRFPFRATKGQTLVLDLHARQLVPYLADAVPGWFQATMALYDPAGNELVFADDFRFNPDPVIFFDVPRDGIYELEIRDAIYRGRQDFVYRVHIGTQPFITRMYPLGGKEGVATQAEISGHNLSETQVTLDTTPGEKSIRQTVLHQGETLSNPMTFAVDTLPERNEQEPNNQVAEAQPIEVPLTLNGQIRWAGDSDVFQFEGRAGDEIVVDVRARRLASPLDALIRLIDASGDVLAWNDDYVEKEGHLYRGEGLLTHYADPYLRFRLPKDGAYFVQIVDAQRHGGAAYAYRLRIAAPRPDFSLRVTPSTLNIRPGTAVPIRVHALRKDGFNGPIDIMLVDAPPEFLLSGARIPANRNSVRMTLRAPRNARKAPIHLKLAGRAKIGSTLLNRPILPADDTMQAFLWRHLVSARELLVTVRGPKYAGRFVQLVNNATLPIPEGGTAEVHVLTPSAASLDTVQLELDNPPDGLTLVSTRVSGDSMVLLLGIEGKGLEAGYAGNLITNIFIEEDQPGKNAKRKRKRRVPYGSLPAIPFEIVKR